MQNNRRSSALIVLAVGVLTLGGSLPSCGPSPSIVITPGSSVVGCDGRFRNEASVTNRTNVEQTFQITFGASNNVGSDPTANPNDPRIRNNADGEIEIGGMLISPCVQGTLAVTAAAQNVQTTQVINVPAVPIRATAPQSVKPNVEGFFNYVVTYTCCPGGAAGAYKLDFSGNVNISNETAVPGTVNCPGGPSNVQISGKLQNPVQTGAVVVRCTAPGAARNCGVTTQVEQARF